MAYEFRTDEPVREGLRRTAREQLDRAVRELTEHITEDPVEAVHAARKAVKKERSLLRLARGSMPAKQRRRENGTLREASGRLAAARDSEAMIDMLDQLSERYVGQLPKANFKRIREGLERVRDEERTKLIGSTRSAQAAVSDLGEVRARVEEWTLRKDGWKVIEEGLRRSYADGRRASRRARSHRSMEEWHAWRKRVKDLWYQHRLLAGVAGPTVAGQAKDAHHLADLLGDDHDLGVLRSALTHGQVQAPADIDTVVRLIDHRREELQTEALFIGARIYAEKPKVFIRRMQRNWKAGRGRHRAAAARHPVELAEFTRVPHAA
jgi:CHAD domain-containing protein